jgi:UDPglucose 6-dehydrogenase
VGSDPRIGRNHFRPGPGWGGSCLPKDTSALLHMSEQFGQPMDLLRAVVDVNQSQFDHVAERLTDLVGGTLEGAVVAAWGLAFKGGTNDLRSSPALEVLSRLAAAGAKVRAYDPAIPPGTDLPFVVDVLDDPYEACSGADALIVLTDWAEFRSLDLDRVASVMRSRKAFDARNVLDPAALQRCGFDLRRLDR